MDILLIGRVALSLAVVFGMLVLAYRLAARSTKSGPRRGADLTVVARQGLTQKTAAVLVDAGTKRYLLGVADGSVTLLDAMDRPADPAPATSATGFAAALDTVNTPAATGKARDGLWLPSTIRREQPPAPEPASGPAPSATKLPGEVAEAASGGGRLGGLKSGLRKTETWKLAAGQVLRGRTS